jgi:hypothetical protein
MTIQEVFVLEREENGQLKLVGVTLNVEKAVDWACSAVRGGTFYTLPLIENEKMHEFLASHGGFD